jgi:hypothetical protein
MDIGVLWENWIIWFAKPDSPVFTEKTYAQNIFHNRFMTF